MPVIYYRTPVGIVRITEEDNFITAISILNDGPAVEPSGSELLKTAICQLDEYFAGEQKKFDPPIKQQGTPFQQDVWQHLLQINYGTTISYAQLADQMKKPTGHRGHCSSKWQNNLWIVVPCHRVIGSDGSLTGYAGGLSRKQWVLNHEACVMGIGQTKLLFLTGFDIFNTFSILSCN